MTEDEQQALFANRYQVVVEDANGKKVTIQHPFITIDECKEEAGRMKTTYPENKIYWEGKLVTHFNSLNVYKRTDVHPYSCDFSKSYYLEEYS